MKTRTQTTLHFNVTKRGCKDLFVVSFLAIVLGAFVAQISSAPRQPRAAQPVAAVCSTSTAY
jgi:hypothetical protein